MCAYLVYAYAYHCFLLLMYSYIKRVNETPWPCYSRRCHWQHTWPQVSSYLGYNLDSAGGVLAYLEVVCSSQRQIFL
jgi:hypothetical protein